MSSQEAHLPAKEVLRFGGALFLRIFLAVLFGVAAMKAGQVLVHWPNDKAIFIGYLATGLFLAVSLYIWRIAWPEVDYGPEPERSLLDQDEDEKAA